MKKKPTIESYIRRIKFDVFFFADSITSNSDEKTFALMEDTQLKQKYIKYMSIFDI